MAESIYDFDFIDNHGQPVDLRDFAGKPLLIVNTASKCGLTPQYEGLQQLHERYADKGLVVIGFPCDQFAGQEPGSDGEIEQFCQLNYGVSFKLATKVKVNGPETHPVFKFLKRKTRSLTGSAVKWNFTKFLVSADGSSVKRFSPTTLPADMTADIEAALAA